MLGEARCRSCGDPVKYNASTQSYKRGQGWTGKPLQNPGWAHSDAMRRDHQAHPHDNRSPEADLDRQSAGRLMGRLKVDHTLQEGFAHLHAEKMVNEVFNDRSKGRDPLSVPGHEIPITGTVHLPPTPEGLENMRKMVTQHQEHRAGEMLGAIEHKDNQRLAKQSAYGMGGHKALRDHLINAHGAWPEDVTRDDAARWHRSWHAGGTEDHGHD